MGCRPPCVAIQSGPCWCILARNRPTGWTGNHVLSPASARPSWPIPCSGTVLTTLLRHQHGPARPPHIEHHKPELLLTARGLSPREAHKAIADVVDASPTWT